jgi:hypothetical protein
VRAQCAALGITVEQLYAGQHLEDDDEEQPPHEVWPEHWGAWRVYLGLSSRWRLNLGLGSAIWEPPAYADVETVMRRYGVDQEVGDDVFCQYQVLEAEAHKLMNEKLRSKD